MADIANLVLAVDSTQVKTGTAALDGLAAAGGRAEAATVGLGGGFRGASAEAAAMASAAQLSARAAMDQAAGFGTATNAARINTMAMRESLVVARELSRGNFTRLPGSLTLLAQGIGSGGGLGAYAQAIGLVKKLGDAELEEAAAAATASAAGVAAAARKAGANILAADTELALAEAQLRVADGAGAEAAAQSRLAAAHQATAAAADEARAAENALAVAQGRAVDAEAQAAARRSTVLGTTGVVLGAVAISAIAAEGAFKALQATVDDSGALDRYAQSITKTKAQLDDLKDKVGGFQITWGDVFHGISKAAGDAIGSASMWDAFKEGNKSAFTSALHNAVEFAANSYGVIRGSYQTIVDDWSKFPAIIGDAFYSAVNAAIGALNKLVKFGTDQLNSLIASANKLPFVHLGTISAPQIGAVGNPYAGAAASASNDLHGNIAKFTAQGRAQMNKNLSTIYDDIVGAAKDRIKDGLGKTPKGRHPREKKENDHGLAEALEKLDAEIKGQYALAAAYQVSDAAVMRATAHQKAEEDAISHKATAGLFYEKELQKAVAERVAKGEGEAAKLRDETGIRKAANDAIAAGSMTLKAANDQMKIQVGLLPLIAAYDNADAAHKKAAADAIRDYTKAQKDSNAEAERTIALQDKQNGADEIERLRLETSLIGASNRERAVALAQLEAAQKYRDVTDPALKADLVAQAVTKAQLGVKTPFEQWASSIPQTSAAITEALQGIEFRGFDSLASSITGVITGTESLGKAFKNVATQIIGDIIQMTIKMLIFRAISGIFGQGNNLATNNGSTAPITWTANGNAFSRGNIIPFANGGVVGSPTMFGMSGGNIGVMGEAGPEAVMPLTRDAHGRLGVRAANDTQRGPIELKISFGAAPDFAPYVEQVAGAAAGQAVQISVEHTNQTIKALRRPSISGAR